MFRAAGKQLLNAQRHDGVDYVVIVLFQGLDGLGAGDTGLGHDELDILVLEAGGINLLLLLILLIVVVVLFVLLGVSALNSLGVVVAVVVTGVVVLGTGGGELLGGSLLGGGVQILNLGLTEDATSYS